MSFSLRGCACGLAAAAGAAPEGTPAENETQRYRFVTVKLAGVAAGAVVAGLSR
jgi:hypothetical protein